MDITKRLDTDNDIEFLDSGTLVQASNIVVNTTNAGIQNENSIKEYIRLNDGENIVGHIACSNEFIIFTDANRIIRCNEKEGIGKEVKSNWKWGGGEVFGDYTYNVNNELIIAISERNTKNKIPLKTINLDYNTYDKYSNEDRYTLNPPIPYYNILKYERIISPNLIYCGTYVFYIRFFFNDYEHTNWVPLGSPGIIYDEGGVHKLEEAHYVADGDPIKVSINQLEDYYTENKEKSYNTLQLYIDIIDKTYNYKYYQIGYIITTTKNATIPIVEYKVPIDNSLFTITNKKDNKYEISIDELTSVSFNLYNVNTLTNYNNRLYVANYIEENNNIKVPEIDVSNIEVRFVSEQVSTYDDIFDTELASKTRSIDNDSIESSNLINVDLISKDVHESKQVNDITYKWTEDRECSNYDFDVNKTYKVRCNGFSTIRNVFVNGVVRPLGVYNKIQVNETNVTVDKDYFILIPLKDYFKGAKTDTPTEPYGVVVIDETDNGNKVVIKKGAVNNFYYGFRKADLDYGRVNEVSAGHYNYFGYLFYIEDIDNPYNVETLINTSLYDKDNIREKKFCYYCKQSFVDKEDNIYAESDLLSRQRNAEIYAYSYHIVDATKPIVNTTIDNTKKEYHKFAVTHNVYNLFIHYVYPNGSYTDGIRLNNNNYKKTARISIGNKDGVTQYYDCDENTTVEDIKNYIKLNNIQYDTLPLSDAYCFILKDVYQDVYVCNIRPDLFVSGNIALYKNNKGERFFRPYISNKTDVDEIVGGHFEFSNIPMYDEFVGYFFSYEETEQICAGKAIISDNTTFQYRKQATNVLLDTYYAWTHDFQTLGFSDFNYVEEAGCIISKYGYDDVLKFKFFPKPYKSLTVNYKNNVYSIKKKNIILPGQDVIGRGALLELKFDKLVSFINYINGADDLNRNIFSVKKLGLLFNYNNNIYTNDSKTLIPFGVITYVGPNQGGKVFNSGKDTASNVVNYDYYIFKEYYDTNRDIGGKTNKVRFNKYQIYCTHPAGARLIDNSPYPIYSKGDFLYPNLPVQNWLNGDTYEYHITAIGYNFASRYPYFSKYLNVKPVTRVFTYNKTQSDGNVIWSHNYTNINIVPDKLDEMFKLSDAFIHYTGNIITNYNKDIYSNFIDNYKKTIRRSDVISDESVENKWKVFKTEQYKIIAENKGDIINITGIGSYLIAHCEHSMFLFNRDSSMKTDNKDVQLIIPDAFDIDYVEVFTSDKGYAGIQKHDQFVCSNYGYIFYDRDSHTLYRYNENNLKDISAGFKHLFNKDIIDINFAIDERNFRLLVSGKINNNTNDKFTLSYSFVNNNWISTHSYWYDKLFNTKNNVYFVNNNSIDKFDLNSFNNYINIIPDNNSYFKIEHDNDNNQYSYIDVAFNVNTPDRVLNYISYVINKSRNNNYSGNKLMIYTNCCYSDYVDISTKRRNVADYKKPYYRFGTWFMNWFKNTIKNIDTISPIQRHTGKLNDILQQNDKADNKLMVGKYFVVRFIFRDNNEKINVDDIQCY